MANCVWGTEETDGDCMGGMHTFVKCVNCDEYCDECTYVIPAEKQIRECVPPSPEEIADIKIGQAVYGYLEDERGRMLSEVLQTGVTTFGGFTIDFRGEQ